MSPLPCKMVESMNPICSLLTVRICRFIQMKTETVLKAKELETSQLYACSDEKRYSTAET